MTSNPVATGGVEAISSSVNAAAVSTCHPECSMSTPLQGGEAALGAMLVYESTQRGVSAIPLVAAAPCGVTTTNGAYPPALYSTGVMPRAMLTTGWNEAAVTTATASNMPRVGSHTAP
jgi:hypothetical protein